ncbi:LysR substrate-binding domain-containing protein [Caulobacter sp. S45]|uniref:LysR substrate-binding domain-containing protein n=1 Tax=Caulobacter sp. S45 TaxID=1641861 RepID=UPI00131D2196|nr:LysR substrate-binding domain-containing protein [Caulobacter sp. S45]
MIRIATPANRPTLRRLVIFEAAVRLGSIGAAANAVGLSQPAATHALSKLEDEVGELLLERGAGGSSPTAAGRILHRRAERMLHRIEASLAILAAPTGRHAARTRNLSDAQVRCHLAIADAGSFRAAAAALDIAEPTLQRAARSLEAALGVALYQRQLHGIAAGPAGLKLASDLRLALLEVDQGLDELAIAQGAADGRLSIGCLPLMPKAVLARAVGELLRTHPQVAISLEEGAHAFLVRSLQNGEIDLILGALRPRRPGPDVRQRRLFADPYVVVVGAHHPLAGRAELNDEDLADHPWVVPWRDTPRRSVVESLFARLPRRPRVVMETSSLGMMGAVLAESPCLTILSHSQIREGAMAQDVRVLPVALAWPKRAVGIVHRTEWLPTAVQKRFMTILLDQAKVFAGSDGRFSD